MASFSEREARIGALFLLSALARIAGMAALPAFGPQVDPACFSEMQGDMHEYDG